MFLTNEILEIVTPSRTWKFKPDKTTKLKWINAFVHVITVRGGGFSCERRTSNSQENKNECHVGFIHIACAKTKWFFRKVYCVSNQAKGTVQYYENVSTDHLRSAQFQEAIMGQPWKLEDFLETQSWKLEIQGSVGTYKLEQKTLYMKPISTIDEQINKSG